MFVNGWSVGRSKIPDSLKVAAGLFWAKMFDERVIPVVKANKLKTCTSLSLGIRILKSIGLGIKRCVKLLFIVVKAGGKYIVVIMKKYHLW
jgi:hypothetical protein